MNDVVSVGFQLMDLSDPETASMEGFDNTKLSAVNCCPTWGIIRYGIHKTMPRMHEDARSMALELGQAAHEAFAAVRIAQLWSLHPDHATAHAARIFGKDKAENLCAVIRNAGTIDASIRHAALEAIYTSGFTDSPYDKRRTVANLEASVSAYTSGYDYQRWPVWVADRREPNQPVGIEQPYAVRITVLYKDGSTIEIKHTGKIDGLHWHREEDGELLVHDNKTSGRLDDTWAKGLELSHQFTGYMVAGALLAGAPINRAVVRGVQIPLPRMVINGLLDVWIQRDDSHRTRWVDWVLHTLQLYNRFKQSPLDAPLYTHSCTRYFRPCPFIPLCYAGDSEREHMLHNEMVVDEWSPLAEEYDG